MDNVIASVAQMFYCMMKIRVTPLRLPTCARFASQDFFLHPPAISGTSKAYMGEIIFLNL